MTELNNRRYPLIDQIRGLAIVLMIFFHFFYDLNIYSYVDINFSEDKFWYGLPRLIVFLFLIAMGLSMPLVHRLKIKWNKFIKRFLLISCFALAISITTYYMFPKAWVYFGTLHCIALCSLVSLPFLRIPKISGLVGLIMLILHLFFNIGIPWFMLAHISMDYIPLFPWLGVVLIGFYLNSIGFHKLKTPSNKCLIYLENLGKHSLLIYILHQPILFGGISIFNKLTAN